MTYLVAVVLQHHLSEFVMLSVQEELGKGTVMAEKFELPNVTCSESHFGSIALKLFPLGTSFIRGMSRGSNQ